MCVPERKRAHPLRALVTWACMLDERSAWGSEPGALLKCKAKQSTLLYISEAFPTDFAVFEAFLGQGYSLVYTVHLEKKENSTRKREPEEKRRLFFVPSIQWSVTLFDVSTEGLVLQHLLPDALIETPLSNRKRNKCFIELKLGWRGCLGVSSHLVCVCVCVCVCVREKELFLTGEK